MERATNNLMQDKPKKTMCLLRVVDLCSSKSITPLDGRPTNSSSLIKLLEQSKVIFNSLKNREKRNTCILANIPCVDLLEGQA